jgi:hypothetical protein
MSSGKQSDENKRQRGVIERAFEEVEVIWSNRPRLKNAKA